MAFALTLGGTVYAGWGDSIGRSVTKTTKNTAKGLARGEVAKSYNKKLDKQKCRCDESNTKVTGCDVDKIISELSAFHTAAESSGFANDVDIQARAYGPDWPDARACANTVRDKVKAQVSYWDYSVQYEKAPSKEVLFRVSVH